MKQVIKGLEAKISNLEKSVFSRDAKIKHIIQLLADQSLVYNEILSIVSLEHSNLNPFGKPKYINPKSEEAVRMERQIMSLTATVENLEYELKKWKHKPPKN